MTGSNQEPRETPAGFLAGPMLYPQKTALIAEICRLLNSLEQRTQEESGLAAGGRVYLYDVDSTDPEADDPTPYGWITQIDAACWVYVPYVAAVEQP